MPCSDDAVKEFKQLFKEKFHIELTDEEAYQKANQLLNLYKVVYAKPLPSRAKEEEKNNI